MRDLICIHDTVCYGDSPGEALVPVSVTYGNIVSTPIPGEATVPVLALEDTILNVSVIYVIIVSVPIPCEDI